MKPINFCLRLFGEFMENTFECCFIIAVLMAFVWFVAALTGNGFSLFDVVIVTVVIGPALGFIKTFA